MARAAVYRSLDRLSDLGLICSAGKEFSSHGPIRLLFTATETASAAVRFLDALAPTPP